MPKIAQRDWSPEYMNWVFEYWYNHGRPTATKLYSILPRERSPEYPDAFREKHFAIPDVFIMRQFVEELFVPRAAKLDLDIREEVDQVLVAEKVEMLKRHAEVGKKMEDMAMLYLENHKDDLGVSNAVKLLVEGLRVERESKGIPATLERMNKMSDEQLLKEIQSLIENSPIEMLPMETVEDAVIIDDDTGVVENAETA